MHVPPQRRYGMMVLRTTQLTPTRYEQLLTAYH
jgi:hypothetical protein